MRHSSHLTGRQAEWSGWTDEPEKSRSFDERALLGWRIFITNQPIITMPHAIKFIRSFRAENHMSCSDLNTFFFLSERESPSLADKIYQLTHYRLLRIEN